MSRQQTYRIVSQDRSLLGLWKVKDGQYLLYLLTWHDGHNRPVASEENMLCFQQLDGKANCSQVETHGIHVQPLACDARHCSLPTLLSSIFLVGYAGKQE